jgi:NAD-dependent DNA ligase
MNKITEFLNTAARHYYNGTPIITDQQFDRLADSVGYNVVGAKQHADVESHYVPMYSLQKYYEDDKITSPLHGQKRVGVSPKLDGAALSHVYVDGQYARSLTRGDGVQGRVVTDKFMATKLIPKTIPVMGVVQIVGELCAPKHVENARNYAAGALNLGSAQDFSTRSVEFFAYGVYPYPTNDFNQDMKLLKSWGFSTVHDKAIELIYPTDGLVFRVLDNDVFESLGHTSKHPRGAYARKERGECVETTLVAVEWQVGKSGKVTPVAILEPVLVGDAMVSRATLNNGEFITALGLYLGCRVAVRRSGEVIPQIVHKIE